MSVLITVSIPGDTEVFQQSLTSRAADYERITAQSQTAGAIHHRFGIGTGYVLVVDEWESEEAFATFFSDPELQKFIGEVGGDLSVPPITTVAEAITAPGDF